MNDGEWSKRLRSAGVSLYDLTESVAFILGERTPNQYHPAFFVGDDFFRCLQVLEALYTLFEDTELADELSEDIRVVISRCEVDLSIGWQPPIFIRTGAPLLDESLVNEPLRWLSEPKYKTVHDPFKKGLSDYLEAINKPQRLADVITDMYEAVEAMARVIIGNNRELSRNQELFIKEIEVSKAYKQLLRPLLREYVEYGGRYRHAAQQGQPKTPPSEPEAESFIYLTGLFIRLALRQAQPSS